MKIKFWRYASLLLPLFPYAAWAQGGQGSLSAVYDKNTLQPNLCSPSGMLVVEGNLPYIDSAIFESESGVAEMAVRQEGGSLFITCPDSIGYGRVSLRLVSGPNASQGISITIERHSPSASQRYERPTGPDLNVQQPDAQIAPPLPPNKPVQQKPVEPKARAVVVGTGTIENVANRLNVPLARLAVYSVYLNDPDKVIETHAVNESGEFGWISSGDGEPKILWVSEKGTPDKIYAGAIPSPGSYVIFTSSDTTLAWLHKAIAPAGVLHVDDVYQYLETIRSFDETTSLSDLLSEASQASGGELPKIDKVTGQLLLARFKVSTLSSYERMRLHKRHYENLAE